MLGLTLLKQESTTQFEELGGGAASPPALVRRMSPAMLGIPATSLPAVARRRWGMVALRGTGAPPTQFSRALEDPAALLGPRPQTPPRCPTRLTQSAW